MSVRVGGLFETHLTTSDLNRSVAFYRDVVGLSLALELPERGAAFFWIGGPGQAMLGLGSLGSAPIGLSLHVAVRATLDDVQHRRDQSDARHLSSSKVKRSTPAEPRRRGGGHRSTPLPEKAPARLHAYYTGPAGRQPIGAGHSRCELVRNPCSSG